MESLIPPPANEVKYLPRSVPFELVKSDLQKGVVRTVFTEKTGGIERISNDLFGPEKRSELNRNISPESISEAMNRSTPVKDDLHVSYTPEEISIIASQDVQERCDDHAALYYSTQAKINVAHFIQETIDAELERTIERRTSDIDTVLLEISKAEVLEQITSLENLQQQTAEISGNTLEDIRNLQKLKNKYLYLTHQIAILGHSLERVSPEMARITNFHQGPIQAKLKEEIGYLPNRGRSVYGREQAGSWAHLLGLSFADGFGLPDGDDTCSSQVEVFTSGMGALSSILQSIENSNAQSIITEGFYFELPRIAAQHRTIDKPLPANDQLYLEIARETKRDTDTPLAIFAQPYGSGLETNIFDLNRALKIIETTESKRPVILILDSTMHGATLNEWQRVQKITNSGKNFTLVEVQSLVKTAQLGMDTVPGGLALAFGSHPEIIRAATGSAGTMMSEHTAAVLFPYIPEVQESRINRAVRNAQYLADQLKQEQAAHADPFIEKIHYASDIDPITAEQYAIKPPFLFVEINSLVPQSCVDLLITQLSGIHRSFPESGRGTSYGFDGTRFELMNIGNNRILRIAAGQESTLQLMAISRYIKYRLNNPDQNRNFSLYLKDEIFQITENLKNLNRKDLETSFYFDVPKRKTTVYSTNYRTINIENYLRDQARGFQIISELKVNPSIAAKLDLDTDSIGKLSEVLDPQSQFQRYLTEWAILQPEFLDALRTKLTIAGKRPTRETAYQLARAVNNTKGVRIVLAPIAKIVNDILRNLQPDIEASLGAKLPFKL